MFSRQLNQIRIDLSLTPRAPLLIRSGRKGADPTRPELECVRTEWGGVKSVYIPGSSLKGVMRSHAERLLVNGAPIKWKALDPTFGRPNAVAVARRTARPHAALLFVDFMLSPEGQELIHQRNRVPASTAVQLLTKRLR